MIDVLFRPELVNWVQDSVLERRRAPGAPIVFVSSGEPNPFRDEGAAEDDGDVTAYPRVWSSR